MSRLIDADAITDHEIIGYLGIRHASCLDDVRELLDEQPTIEAVPMVHGDITYRKDIPHCSICGKVIDANSIYCKWCGAKMKGGAE